jgi:dUTP pyrophosphatase
MTVRRIKLLHPDAKIPTRTHEYDAGYDCYLVEDLTLKPRSFLKFSLGFAIQIKEGQMMTIRSRSSTKVKGASCSETTCDAGYTGQLYGFLINHTDQELQFKKGERCVQIVFIKISTEEIVEGTLPESQRGSKGFGSSGR